MVRSTRPALLLTILLAALLTGPGTASAAGTVHLRGTAYEFNKVDVLLAGATIRVAERPALRATVKADGTYDLVVPDRASITPYIVAAGHHTIYLQTFRTAGEDLANVNFQTPSEPIYRGLVALLGVPVDAGGDPVACAIVSTFSTKDVRDRDFAGFVAYGAHGVAGATASGTPALPAPTYFNENVIPDPAQRVSSKDGGVVWTGVPAGVYTVTARHPTRRFAPFTATCAPGRIVNANPPWGLHELGAANPARITSLWAEDGTGFQARKLRIVALPAKPVVTVRCTGPGCAFGVRRFLPRTPTLDLWARLGGSRHLRLRAGQTLDVTVTAPGFDGTTVRFRSAGGRRPVAQRRCIPLGNTLPRPHC
jgi:hypothetical protein